MKHPAILHRATFGRLKVEVWLASRSRATATTRSPFHNSRTRGLLLALALLAGLAPLSAASRATTVRLREEFARTLTTLVETLESRQVGPSVPADAGALTCPHCPTLHTRAAEAVWPLAFQFAETGNERHLQAARALASWLFRQQQPDGSWKETPEEWTGTTTDQLLMLVLAYPKVSARLEPAERQAWLRAIEGAADYLTRVMSPEFASINYCATTTASLAATHALVAKPAYLQKARALARATVARMDEDGFLNGEGGKTHDLKSGVDLGYTLEMSFWGLGYYARLTGDTLVNDLVRAALRPHLTFIYPDGSMDGSWGIRSNKWTTYGSATSDGCQVLFMLYADEDPTYPTAAFRNLEFLRTCLRDGLVQYGPHHAVVMAEPPCLYPTFAKAKNLAMAMMLEPKAERPLVDLPSQRPGWQRHFATLDVVATRTRNFMATTTAYGYKDIAKGAASKYMFRPAGGALSYLWLEGHGMLQASSQTEYNRWEPMHFPEAPGLRPLTPRIEYARGKTYFTNLFEFDGRLQASTPRPGEFVVATRGELKDRNWHYGGVGYLLTHTFRDAALTKEVTLFYRGADPAVTIVEPIILHPGMTVVQTDPNTVVIHGAQRRLRLQVTSGEATLTTGREADKYWSPYPALRAFPIEITVPPPGERLRQSVTLEISLIGDTPPPRQTER
jgi:hypothetical protein